MYSVLIAGDYSKSPKHESTPLLRSSSVRVLLVEKTDRLYRNLKDYVTMDELDLEIHFVKESVVLSKESRSSEKFMHGIKVLMAKNYIDNLSEETRKGMLEKAVQSIYPSFAPLGYRNVMGLTARGSLSLILMSLPSSRKSFNGTQAGNVQSSRLLTELGRLA